MKFINYEYSSFKKDNSVLTEFFYATNCHTLYIDLNTIISI